MKTISPTAKVSPLADLEASVRGSRLVVGAGCVVDAFVKMKFAGGSGDIVLGENTYINSGCVIYSGNGVTVGNNVLIAANCTIAATNHEYRARDRLIVEQRFMPSRGGIIIEDDVWIGAGAVLVDGAIVRKGCVIGALALVRGETEPYTVYVGNPLRVAGKRQ